MSEFPALMTVQEAAKVLKSSQDVIYKLLKSGKIKGTREFGKWLILADDFRSKFLQAVNRQHALAERG